MIYFCFLYYTYPENNNQLHIGISLFYLCSMFYVLCFTAKIYLIFTALYSHIVEYILPLHYNFNVFLRKEYKLYTFIRTGISFAI